jgi:hypothetical protein
MCVHGNCQKCRDGGGKPSKGLKEGVTDMTQIRKCISFFKVP